MQLHRQIDRIHAAGARIHSTGAEVFVIGNGSPSFIDGFREETGWAGPIFTDPSLAAYRAAELERGVAATFSPFAIGATIKALAAGRRQGRTQGDALQQGGVLVIAPSGDILWHQVSARSGDNASVDQIVAALDATTRGTSSSRTG